MGKILIKLLVLLLLWIVSEVWNQSVGLTTFLIAFVFLGALRSYEGRERPIVGILHHFLALIVTIFIEFLSMSTLSISYVIIGASLPFALIYFTGMPNYIWKVVGWIPVMILMSIAGSSLSIHYPNININFISIFCIVILLALAYELLFGGLVLVFKKMKKSRIDS
jgi:hypothetical protein